MTGGNWAQIAGELGRGEMKPVERDYGSKYKIRVAMREWQGYERFDIRQLWEPNGIGTGDWSPTKKGFFVDATEALEFLQFQLDVVNESGLFPKMVLVEVEDGVQ